LIRAAASTQALIWVAPCQNRERQRPDRRFNFAETTHPYFCRRLKPALKIKRGFDPRATLAALAHPGLLSVATPRLIEADIRVDSGLSWRYHLRRNHKSLDRSAGSVFLNLLGAAKGALIRAAASTLTFAGDVRETSCGVCLLLLAVYISR